MPGNISIEKTKCDLNSINSNSVSKLFYGLLSSKNGLDLIRTKKCQQQANPQLRRSFKLLKAHRSESNLPFKQHSPSFHSTIQLNDNQLTKLPDKASTGSLCDLKMKSNNEAVLTTAQIANVISDGHESNSPFKRHSKIQLDEDEKPLPPIRTTSIQSNLRSPINQTAANQQAFNQLTNYPNYNRELPSLPINEERRKSISFNSRLSPDDGGFSSFDCSSSNKRNSISVLNNRNFSNNQAANQAYRNNFVNQHNHSLASATNKYGALITNDKWANLPTAAAYDAFQQENNLFNNQRNYFSDVDQHLDLDLDYYQNMNSNNYALSSQKSDNWSSSTSVLSTYTGITSSSTSDYYTTSETITNSPSLSSLNSAGLCTSSMNNCNSPPLNGAVNRTNLAKYSGNNSLVSSNNNIANHLNTNKQTSYMRQFSYPGSQLLSTKLAKSPVCVPANTGIAKSSLVEKPKRQESASVLYYIVAKDTPNNEFNNSKEPQANKINESNFNKCPTHSVNYNGNSNDQQTDLKVIQKSLHEFYLRHKANSKDSQNQTEQQSNSSTNKKAFNSLINYSLTSNDSVSSNSSTISPVDSPTQSYAKVPTIMLPAKPSYLNSIQKLTSEEETRLNELKAKAIYSNIHFDSLNGLETKEETSGLMPTAKELRLSFRERCSPFENSKQNSSKPTIETSNKPRNELKNLNQPNSVKSIAKQFDSLSNCDLNANRVSPVQIGKNALHKLNGTTKELNFDKIESNFDEVCSKLVDQSDVRTENQENESNDGKLSLESNEDYKMKLKENDEKLRLFLEFLRQDESLSKVEYSKITLHIEEVDKVSKLIISLTNRLNKIEGILQLRHNQQQINNEHEIEPNDSQLTGNQIKYKQSTSTDSLLADEKNLFSSILSLSSISLNNLNCNGSAFFASIEMLNSKKNKILDQLEEAMQLKQMIERRCHNLNDRIICKYFDFAKIDYEMQENRVFSSLKDFNFVDAMQDKHELSIKSRELEANTLR